MRMIGFSVVRVEYNVNGTRCLLISGQKMSFSQRIIIAYSLCVSITNSECSPIL